MPIGEMIDSNVGIPVFTNDREDDDRRGYTVFVSIMLMKTYFQIVRHPRQRSGNTQCSLRQIKRHNERNNPIVMETYPDQGIPVFTGMTVMEGVTVFATSFVETHLFDVLSSLPVNL